MEILVLKVLKLSEYILIYVQRCTQQSNLWIAHLQRNSTKEKQLEYI